MYKRAAELASELSRHGVLCDVGGGTGNLYRALAVDEKNPLYYVLVDPDPGLTMEAPRTAQTEIVHGVAEALPLRRKACNVVVFFDSLHHFSNTSKAVEEAVRAAQCIVVEDIDKSRLIGKIIAWLEKLLGCPANFTSPRRLEQELGALGLKLGTSEYGQGLIPVYRIVGCMHGEEHGGAS
jgi:SAM-dependent methyltransferase